MDDPPPGDADENRNRDRTYVEGEGGGDDDGGCHVATTAGTRTGWSWLPYLLAIGWRARRRLRGRS